MHDKQGTFALESGLLNSGHTRPEGGFDGGVRWLGSLRVVWMNEDGEERVLAQVRAKPLTQPAPSTTSSSLRGAGRLTTWERRPHDRIFIGSLGRTEEDKESSILPQTFFTLPDPGRPRVGMAAFLHTPRNAPPPWMVNPTSHHVDTFAMAPCFFFFGEGIPRQWFYCL